ncbi:hypothetical protein [Saccharibacillus sp. JS10]|nr:hypothetical protein [Saccharibacillus sp. JS10]MCQ4085852.1 hypothetical protein [Saccharibacillus sp. JS10]
MQMNNNGQQFSDVLEEVNFILYGSKQGKPEEELDHQQEQQAEVVLR